MIATASCSKDDDQVQPVSQSSSVSERVTYTTHIEPLARKTCSAANCHNGITSSTFTAGRMIASAHNGTIDALLLSNKGDSPCGKLDNESIGMLQAWVNAGAPLK